MSRSDDRDDILLGIVEKIYDKQEVLNSKFEEMKEEQIRQNIIVTEHERRSTASEKRLALLEKDAQFIRHVLKMIGYAGTVVLFIVKAYPFLSSHL